MASKAHRLKQRLRKRAHAALDPIWQTGEKSRNKLYRWLSWKMGIAPSECHFSRMNADQLQQAIILVNERRKLLRPAMSQ
jgi:hypothetical protein